MPKKETEMAGKEKQDSSRSRGGRLAQRARSFKEDLLEKFTQMRSPSARSSSPHKASPRAKHKNDTLNSSGDAQSMRRNEKDVQQLQKDVQFALRYFQDVVDKDILEMLPGSATVVLENILAIHTQLKNDLANEQSSLLLSTTNQVHQSLANLIRWADNVLLYGNQSHNKENVSEIVKGVSEAIKTLIQLAEDKLQNKESKSVTNNVLHNGVCTLKPDSPKRTSLPDIPLTPREREILEQTTFSVDDGAIQLTSTPTKTDNFPSDDCVDSSSSSLPPPKPPLPSNWGSNWLHNRCPSTGNMLDVIPPLPPKRKTAQNQSESLGNSFQSTGGIWNGNISPTQHAASLTSLGHRFASTEWNNKTTTNGVDGNSNSLEANSFSDWGSSFGSSPDSSSPMNASATSLDSVLNRSADDLLRNNGVSSTTTTTSVMADAKSHFASWTNSPAFEAKTSAMGELHQLQIKLQEFSYSRSEEKNSRSTWKSSTSSTDAESRVESVVTFNSSSSSLSHVVLPPPPAIPPKKRNLKRTPSQYDNLPDMAVMDSSEEEHAPTDSSSPIQLRRKMESHSFTSSVKHTEESVTCGGDGIPPPLPPKKKHIMAYVQMFGSYSEPNKNEFFRHSLHTFNLLQAQWQQQQQQEHNEISLNLRSLTTGHHLRSSSDELITNSNDVSFNSCTSSTSDQTLLLPPALPPKRNRASVGVVRHRPSTSPTTPSPPLCDLKEKSASMIESGTTDIQSEKESSNRLPNLIQSDSGAKTETKKKTDVEDENENPLDSLNVDAYLIHKKTGDEGPDIRGGSVDALIVRATKVNKNDFMYQEAFLTTYRTFITPLELVKKLLYRYTKFSMSSEVTRQRAARNAFALLVRVVDDLCVTDVEDVTMQTLMDFVFQLLCNGDLILGRALRKKILEKCDAKKKANTNSVVLLSSYSVTTRQSILLDFKSEQLAEQMILLDADLFQKIEIPEVLIWAREQSEELSPNLTTFTEHFNKMSYWARSRILDQDDAKDRERYVVKFIKIMKHLRRLNNFNSYLAILSALDSAPIRRLEWQRHITEGLKEYCELIDSSSSFRAYRQALAETEPPCIPYIGLILQDLTFVHIGNNDFFSDGNVNFSKRWQQFNILDNMRRFKKCNYRFKRHDKIIAFFNNFDNYLCEESMWQISESIKPRGGKKKMDHS